MPTLTDISVFILAVTSILAGINHYKLLRRVEDLENK